MTALTLNPQEIIIAHGSELRTDSRKVADSFGKYHKDVLRKIESLDCSPEFASAHFCAHVENQVVGTAKRDLKFYEMTKDGFMFLVMGFTGKRAAQIKEAYINAFNWMAGQLINGKTTTDDRTPLRDAVNMLVGKKGLMYPEAYSLVHQRFAVEHIDQLKPEQIPQAVEYVHRLVLEGEVLLPEPEPAPAPAPAPATVTLSEEEACRVYGALRTLSRLLAKEKLQPIERALRILGSTYAADVSDLYREAGMRVHYLDKVMNRCQAVYIRTH